MATQHQNVRLWNSCIKISAPQLPDIIGSNHKTTQYEGNDTPLTIKDMIATVDHGLVPPLIKALNSQITGDPDDLNLHWLTTAKSLIDCKNLLGKHPPIRTEEETADRFVSLVAEPVQFLARALGIQNLTLESVDAANRVKPDRIFKVNRQAVLVVEFKNPTCGGKHFADIVEQASGTGLPMDLGPKDSSSKSILVKLAGYCALEKIKYGLLVDMQNFLIIQYGGTVDKVYQFRMSPLISINSLHAPIISVILQIIKEFQPAGANETVQLQQAVTPTTDESGGDESEEDQSEGDRREDRREDRWEEDHGMDEGSDDDDTSRNTTGSRTPTAYWIPRDIGPTSLAAVLENQESVSVRWRVPRYREVIWLTARWPNTTVWHTALPSTDLSTSIHQADPFTSPPSPPSVPFEIHLDREIISHVFDAHMPGVAVRLIAKFTPTDQAERELAAWRKLRHMAGTRIPGLFGVYSVKGCKTGPHAFIIQQYAGRSPPSYTTLNMKQRKELYHTVRLMHRSGIKHGDIAPRNVALNDKGDLRVLDFGRSNSHDCPGESCCEELVDLMFALDLNQNESLKSLSAQAPPRNQANQR